MPLPDCAGCATLGRCSKRFRSRRSARGRLDTLQVNVGYRCNQSCVHCHVNAGPGPHRGDDAATVADLVLDVPRAAAHRDARHHRRRARAQSALPPPGARAARDMGVQRDGPLQPHDPGAAGPGGPRRIPRRATRSRSSRRCRATCRTTSTGSAARACIDGSIRGLRRLNALGYGREGSRARRSTSSTIRRGRRCRRRRRSSRPTTSASSASASASSFNQPLHARQHADPALRLDPARRKGQFDALSRHCCSTRTATTTSTA